MFWNIRNIVEQAAEEEAGNEGFGNFTSLSWSFSWVGVGVSSSSIKMLQWF